MTTIYIGIGTALIYHFLWFPFVERQKILQINLKTFLESTKKISKLLKSYHFQIVADSKDIALTKNHKNDIKKLLDEIEISILFLEKFNTKFNFKTVFFEHLNDIYFTIDKKQNFINCENDLIDPNYDIINENEKFNNIPKMLNKLEIEINNIVFKYLYPFNLQQYCAFLNDIFTRKIIQNINKFIFFFLLIMP